MLDLLVRNGTVVTAEGSYPYDVAIQRGKVAAIGPHGTLGEAKETVDAAGKLVLPGLIDPHVHIHHPFKGSFAGDDFTSATRSAAFGGVTTVCDFAIQWDKTKSLTDTCALRKSQFEGQSITDYAFHACLTRSDAETIGELPGLIQGGIPSAKLYMTYSRQGRMSDDAALYEALRLTAQHGGIVGVHAENDAMCYYFSDAFKAAGKTSPHYFPLCKHNLVESEAVNRAIYLAKVTGGNLYIFHLSCKESLDILRKAQDEGVHVYAETCIHYLTMDMSQYDRPDGANFICSPPLRSKADVEALWQGIQEGRIGVVSSDHCGFTLANKATGGNDFTATPNGLPGMETRLPALYTYGVKAGRISLSKMVELLSANPARAFGMYPRKGTLAPGSDGDLVIFDPAEEKVISPAVLHSPVDWNPFDGQTLSGFAQAVYLAGKPIIQDGACLAAPGAGKFVQRDAKAICIFDR